MNFYDYLFVIKNRWKFIFYNMLLMFSVSVIISLIMPKTFKASTVLMPPKSQSEFGLLGALSGLPMSDLLIKPDDDTMDIIAILKSRTLMEDVIDKFDLMNYYDLENIEQTLDAFSEAVDIEIENEGTIHISVFLKTGWFHEDQNELKIKKMCADIANYFVKKLDEINKGLKSETAFYQREFIEKRYKENLFDLQKAESDLKFFQESNKMIFLSEQALASIELAATIKAQLLASEIELGVSKKLLNSSHHEIILLENQILELEQQLNKINYGSDSSKSNDYFPTFSKVPDLGLQLGRLTREVTIQNTLFTFLTQQLEEAKINEMKDTPTIQILDKAVVPNIKHHPKRFLIIISTIFSTFLIVIFYLLFIENKLSERRDFL